MQVVLYLSAWHGIAVGIYCCCVVCMYITSDDVIMIVSEEFCHCCTYVAIYPVLLFADIKYINYL